MTTAMLTYEVMTEAELDRNIRHLCRDLGLRCYHTHDSRRSPAGFPDLVIVGPNGILFAELKSAAGKLRPEQGEWRDDLIAAGQTWHLWRPDGLADGTIAAELSKDQHLRENNMTTRQLLIAAAASAAIGLLFAAALIASAFIR